MSGDGDKAQCVAIVLKHLSGNTLSALQGRLVHSSARYLHQNNAEAH